jgi:hypothetical protein
MIRRTAIALAFMLFGFLSLLVVNFTYTWTCHHFSGFCKVYTGPCPGIDTCTPDTLSSVVLSAVYFGPSIVFGIAGFLFSKQPRRAVVWGALLVCLILAHSVVMISALQATTS